MAERVSFFLKLTGEVNLHDSMGEDDKSHDSKRVDDGKQEQKIAEKVQEHIDSDDDSLDHHITVSCWSKEILDVGLDKAVKQIKQESNDEVSLSKLPKNWYGVSPELSGKNADLGHILNWPAILTASELAGSKRSGFLLLSDNSTVCHTKLPHAISASAQEHFPPGRAQGLLLVEEDLLPWHQEQVGSHVILVQDCFFIFALVQSWTDVGDIAPAQDGKNDDEENPVQVHAEDCTKVRPA
mmetsp:Transcript_4817/g.17499  ORF Transcript_4817/g.17499 Transcript_4817/m.17499 type:complete len:240 (-) Transcript_4817:416-1135(-)